MEPQSPFHPTAKHPQRRLLALRLPPDRPSLEGLGGGAVRTSGLGARAGGVGHRQQAPAVSDLSSSRIWTVEPNSPCKSGTHRTSSTGPSVSSSSPSPLKSPRGTGVTWLTATWRRSSACGTLATSNCG